jgi:hypothetical protein
MSPPGRPKGESRALSARGGSISPPGRPKGESRAHRARGGSISPTGRPEGEPRTLAWINPFHAVARVLAAFALLALAGCGGGMQAGVGSGGSGAPMEVGLGPVTGFGSIIVNGIRYDETQAEVLLDERPDRPMAASVAAIRLGTVVALQHRSLVVATATIGAELIGPVSSVSASSFVALGQTVRVNAGAASATVYEGFSTLSDLSTGAIVEVHGERSGSGEILATRVELRPAGLPLVRLAGTVSNVNGRSFTIGTLSVDATSASIVPAGATLADGQRVVVWTDVPYTGGTLVPKVVRIGQIAVADNASVTADGVVAAFQSVSMFRVGGLLVDASGAAFTGGTAADLANGRPVRVRGTFANGMLRASNVELLPTTPAETNLTGAITDFVDAASPFRIRGTLVRATPQTTYVNGSVANLGDSVRVKLSGPITNGVVHATTVEFLPVAMDMPQVVTGAIAAPVGAPASDGSRTFRLDGLAPEVKTTSATSYRSGSAADIAAGRRVRIRGALQSGQFVADEVQFLDNPSEPAVVEIEGTAGNVQPNSVVVNGQSVQLTASTTYTLDGVTTDSATLRNGAKVQIVANRVAGVVTALSVEIESDSARATSVRGTVSGRNPPTATEFMVGAQRVSVAGNPQIVPGNRTLADVVNGADVEVDGTVSGGVLRATRIKFR